MIKITTNLFVLLLVVLLICVGCNKDAVDGIYKPDKQIAKVHTKTTFAGFENPFGDDPFWDDPFGNLMSETQTWIWSDNRLEKITYQNTWGSSSMEFYYDGDKLSKIIEGNTVLSIGYKGNKFDKINVSYDDYLIGTFTFKHSNGKITEVTYIEPGSAKAGKASNNSMNRMLEFLLPARTSKILSKEIEYLAQNTLPKAGKYEFKVVLKFNWNGDNVRKVTITEREDGEKDREVQTYKYDKNKNPFINFFGGEFSAESASVNNIVSITTRYYGGTDTETYTYEYDSDGYPIKRSYTSFMFGMTETTHIEYK